MAELGDPNKEIPGPLASFPTSCGQGSLLAKLKPPVKADRGTQFAGVGAGPPRHGTGPRTGQNDIWEGPEREHPTQVLLYFPLGRGEGGEKGVV